jgi:hypothetical protein
MKTPTVRTRAYVYRLALAILAVGVAYGFLGPDESDALSGVIEAVAGLSAAGLAVANTSTRKTPSDDS